MDVGDCPTAHDEVIEALGERCSRLAVGVSDDSDEGGGGVVEGQAELGIDEAPAG